MVSRTGWLRHQLRREHVPQLGLGGNVEVVRDQIDRCAAVADPNEVASLTLRRDLSERILQQSRDL
jgi:hypothetical protein